MYQISYMSREILSKKSLAAGSFPNPSPDVDFSLQPVLATVVGWNLKLIA